MTTENSADDSEPADADSQPSQYHVTSTDGMEEGDRLLIEIAGKSIAIFRGSDDFYAVSNHCPHQGGPICEGRMLNPLDSTRDEDDWALAQNSEVPTVACPWHGWEFDLETGEHVAPSNYCLRSFDTIVQDGELYIEV